MKTALATVLIAISCIALAPVLVASGGHGGGHSGGGHSSGGHAAAGGHASGGHGGGHTSGTASSGGTAAPRTTGTARPTSDGTKTGRPRNGQPIVGTAVPRTGARSTPLGVPLSLYPVYRGWPYYGTALAFGGLGFYTNPFSSGYGYDGYGYDGFAYSGYPAALPPYSVDADGPTGGLRLKVEPKQAQVFVDGYYAGIVDDFNGHFHHLNLTPGPHHVEIRAPGYEPLAIDVSIEAHHTTEYRGALYRSVQ
jgi:hypothetical protein